jgi:hypothetical protein
MSAGLSEFKSDTDTGAGTSVLAFLRAEKVGNIGRSALTSGKWPRNNSVADRSLSDFRNSAKGCIFFSSCYLDVPKS